MPAAKNVSYNLSPRIRSNLIEVTSLRKRILSSIIPRDLEAKLRWESTLSQIYWSLKIRGSGLTKRKMAKLLIGKDRKNMAFDEKEVLDYKGALDYIYLNWYITPTLVTPDDIIKLHKISSKSFSPKPNLNKFKTLESDVNKFLSYTQSPEENPVMQAGIAQIELRLLSPFETLNGQTSRLLSHLFLSKYGYDFRGLLVMDEYIHQNLQRYKNIVLETEKSKNITLWLEFYTEGVRSGLKKALEKIYIPRKINYIPSSHWALTKRQLEILNILENPSIKITNKDIQKLFKVSQITASRDLNKLTNLSFLLRHAGGRSTFYTKA